MGQKAASKENANKIGKSLKKAMGRQISKKIYVRSALPIFNENIFAFFSLVYNKHSLNVKGTYDTGE